MDAVDQPVHGSTRRRSRWAHSEVTFGPRGRIVATLGMFVPVWFFLFHGGAYGLVGLPIWVFTFLPMGLRDIWRASPPTAADRQAVALQEALARPERPLGEAIRSRPGQQRW